MTGIWPGDCDLILAASHLAEINSALHCRQLYEMSLPIAMLEKRVMAAT